VVGHVVQFSRKRSLGVVCSIPGGSLKNELGAPVLRFEGRSRTQAEAACPALGLHDHAEESCPDPRRSARSWCWQQILCFLVLWAPAACLAAAPVEFAAAPLRGHSDPGLSRRQVGTRNRHRDRGP